ncbi:hypothetical protein GPX89_13110 [Nocardia sp. ET3-3]|uniref:Terpene synthase n=1 Tax=Nocardia terrae TaxID=2675851 RepID=A0A7K1UV77_9NOCA|nr:hypothetical protein [Nocardia terrae]MVU78181.1 hypothetical protein [Nocardia terrae]
MLFDRAVLPDFYMPYRPEGVNPRVAAAEAMMWRWLESWDLVPSESARRRVMATRPADMYALWCPEVGVETLGLLSQFAAWAFIVDDQFDIELPDPKRCLETIGRLEVGFQATGMTTGVLAGSLRDLWRRLCYGRSQPWRNGVRAEMQEWLWSYYTESIRTVTGELPTLDEYRTHRQVSVGIYMLLDLSEIAYGFELPDPIRRLPALKSLRAAVTDHMGLINDIHSLQADEAVGYKYNAVLLAEHYGVHPRTDAIEAVNDMLTDGIQRIHRLEGSLMRELDVLGVTEQEREDTIHTLGDYRRYLRANFDFHYRAPRYTSPPAEALEHGGLLT